MHTVLVTGAAGFIAQHVVAQLLERGFAVRGTVRKLDRGEQVRESLASSGIDVAGLDFVVADLDDDAGWDEAVAGCRYVQHLASPFPLEPPRDREALVPAAREGALRVARAARAADVERLVVTSSMVAMMYRAGRPPRCAVDESSWTDPDWTPLTAYVVSKTRAERALWDWAEAEQWRESVATVNPAFVLGPGIGDGVGTSLEVIRMFMQGAYPAVPPVAYPVVDVRDVAAVHVAAMTTPAAGGRRLIASDKTLSFVELARLLKRKYPQRRLPVRQLPRPLVRLVALFDRPLRSVLQDLGVAPEADASYVTDLLDVAFRPAEEAALASAAHLVSRGLV
ncbi:MAG: NAD-dependent epimerase/dehydratase family protein [Pseudomonadota bacterium]